NKCIITIDSNIDINENGETNSHSKKSPVGSKTIESSGASTNDILEYLDNHQYYVIDYKDLNKASPLTLKKIELDKGFEMRFMIDFSFSKDNEYLILSGKESKLTSPFKMF
ncbi:4089_t:CDS:2, partial [Gigaspora rosea]